VDKDLLTSLGKRLKKKIPLLIPLSPPVLNIAKEGYHYED
jgi:hypothetical protein